MSVRTLSYAQAIREASAQLLASDRDVFILGQGLWSPWYVGNSMTDLDREFGRERIIDSPVSENATTGAAIGAALSGMRPIVVHPRMDFMLLAYDQLVNQAANWSYMFGGRSSIPMVVRPIINRGGEQGAQHSQALHAVLAHVPGLKVVMPATAYDAKGLLISAVYDGNPVIYIDDRWLYGLEDAVPDSMYRVPIGKAAVRRTGTQVTIVASSYLAAQAVDAAHTLADEGIDAEVIDLRTVKPIDEECVLESVRKTGRLVVADGGWRFCGLAAEVAALAAEKAYPWLKAPIRRLTLPEAPAPVSASLERVYYARAADIVQVVRQAVS